MEGNGHHQQLEAGSRRQPQRQEAFVAGDGGSRAAARPRRPRVVRAAVDEDLYKVPSDMLRKKKGVRTLPFCLLLSTSSLFSSSFGSNLPSLVYSLVTVDCA